MSARLTDKVTTDYSSRNQIALLAASFIGFTGFTLVMPFLPLYFRELGVTDIGKIALWSGLSLGVTPGMTALLAPTWGRLADRFSRKIMVLRSLLSFVVVMAAAAFVTQAWHMLALRIVHGFFAGYGALIIAMAAEDAPHGKVAKSIGRMQAVQRLGPMVGPLLGGLLAQLVGLRPAFLAASCLFGIAFLIMLFMYREPDRLNKEAVEAQGKRVTFRNAMAFHNFLLLMGIIFCIEYVDRSFRPVLPLLIAQLGVPLDRVALISGFLFSIGAGLGAFGHRICSVLFRYRSPRVLLMVAISITAVSVMVFAVASELTMLIIAMPIFGIAIGVGLTTAYTTASRVIPSGAHGTGFGFLASASMSAFAVSPIVSGFLGATSIRAVFALDVVVLVVLVGLVSKVMVERPLKVESPQVGDV